MDFPVGLFPTDADCAKNADLQVNTPGSKDEYEFIIQHLLHLFDIGFYANYLRQTVHARMKNFKVMPLKKEAH